MATWIFPVQEGYGQRKGAIRDQAEAELPTGRGHEQESDRYKGTTEPGRI